MVFESGDMGTMVEPRVVKRSADGKNVVREHVFMAML